MIVDLSVEDAYQVIAVFDVDGEEVVGVFSGYRDEGRPAVRGLPPLDTELTVGSVT